MKKIDRLSPILVAVVASAGLVGGAEATAAVPRGADVHPMASGCGIGPFHQTTKAGPYNVLCNVMPDAEKCLALIKAHFRVDSQGVVSVQPMSDSNEQRGDYCLAVLKRDLGL